MLSKVSPSQGPDSPRVIGFYEEPTGSIQYVVVDQATRKAALIDVVWGFDPGSAATNTSAAEEILQYVKDEGLDVQWILDTHPHADHFMASSWLKEQTGAPAAIGEKVHDVAKLWRELYNEPNAFDPDCDFDRLFADGDVFHIGNLPVRVMLSPGHTLASITYVVGEDAAFVHDTLMHVDFGTSRADFPGGSARQLYRSIHEILSLPDHTRLFVGHDYGTEERDEPAWEATVAEHKANNKHVGGGVPEDDYVKLREGRDATLALPDRMLYALQVNLRGGRLPPADTDGHHYFRIPANRF
ncbi:MAG TPA: MBL fold metallo-hydrolase [Alphaproteobacteria bacterium]|nr:MBL fold metallo-hydrolase [Alphaproteobacteria bacterium]